MHAHVYVLYYYKIIIGGGGSILVRIHILFLKKKEKGADVIDLQFTDLSPPPSRGI